MLDKNKIAEKIAADFAQFDFIDQPLTTYCNYQKEKHIAMATQIVCNAFTHKLSYLESDVDDMIHGLNHIFFNGVSAGQVFEWKKGQ